MDPWAQRRVSVSGVTLRLPAVVLVFVVVDLAWEVVKANLDRGVRGEWPWRFTVLDVSSCATLVTLLGGIVVTRVQLSHTLRPVLSWSGFRGDSHQVVDSRRTVMVRNAGGGRAVVCSVSYRLRAAEAYAGRVAEPPGWVHFNVVVDFFEALGLERDRDFFLLHVGAGAAIPMSSNWRDGMELLALNAKGRERLSVVDIRLVVCDVLGDTHQRDLHGIRPSVTSSAT
ncbi:hypothetical protein ACWGR4_42385 [Embleya sp. NPDC055664]|uniref:hypothetical protein n=1 Tax=Embleya sp. NPDC059237 TaxID=3346784 RepID=UPI0036876C91